MNVRRTLSSEGRVRDNANGRDCRRDKGPMVVHIRLVVVRARAKDDAADLVHRSDPSERTGKTDLLRLLAI